MGVVPTGKLIQLTDTALSIIKQAKAVERARELLKKAESFRL